MGIASANAGGASNSAGVSSGLMDALPTTKRTCSGNISCKLTPAASASPPFEITIVYVNNSPGRKGAPASLSLNLRTLSFGVVMRRGALLCISGSSVPSCPPCAAAWFTVLLPSVAVNAVKVTTTLVCSPTVSGPRFAQRNSPTIAVSGAGIAASNRKYAASNVSVSGTLVSSAPPVLVIAIV